MRSLFIIGVAVVAISNVEGGEISNVKAGEIRNVEGGANVKGGEELKRWSNSMVEVCLYTFLLP